MSDRHAPFVTFGVKTEFEAWIISKFLQTKEMFFESRATKSEPIVDRRIFTQKRNQINRAKNDTNRKLT